MLVAVTSLCHLPLIASVALLHASPAVGAPAFRSCSKWYGDGMNSTVRAKCAAAVRNSGSGQSRSADHQTSRASGVSFPPGFTAASPLSTAAKVGRSLSTIGGRLWPRQPLLRRGNVGVLQDLRLRL